MGFLYSLTHPFTYLSLTHALSIHTYQLLLFFSGSGCRCGRRGVARSVLVTSVVSVALGCGGSGVVRAALVVCVVVDLGYGRVRVS